VWGPLTGWLGEWWNELGTSIKSWWDLNISIPLQESWLKLKGVFTDVDEEMAKLQAQKRGAGRAGLGALFETREMKRMTGRGRAFIEAIQGTQLEQLMAGRVNVAAMQNAGMGVAGEFQKGLTQGWEAMDDDMQLIWQRVMAQLPQSPPEDTSSPFTMLPEAGAGILRQLYSGMEAEAPKFREDVATLLGQVPQTVTPVVEARQRATVEVRSRVAGVEGGIRELAQVIRSEGAESRKLLSEIRDLIGAGGRGAREIPQTAG